MERSPRQTWLGAAGAVLVFGVAALYAAHPIFSGDLFWHLEFGEWIAANARVPTTDLFSAVHPDKPWVGYFWLWELLAHWIVSAHGLLGVRVAQALLSGFTLCGAYLILWRGSGRASFGLLFASAMLMLAEDRFRARPDAFTLVFVVALLPLWLGKWRDLSGRGLFGVAALAALWANIHGGAALLMLAGSGALLVGALGEGLFGVADGSPKRAAAKQMAATVLGLACSPTLGAGFSTWMRDIGPQLETGNQEWLPTYQLLGHAQTASLAMLALAPSVMLVVYVAFQWRRVKSHGVQQGMLGEWLLCGGMLLLSQQAVRNVFLCLVPLAFVLVQLARREPRVPQTAEGLALALAVSLLVVSFQDAIVASYGSVARARQVIRRDVIEGQFPALAGDFLSESGIEGRVFNYGQWGGYLTWRAWPKLSVFIDSRYHVDRPMERAFLQSAGLATRTAALDGAFTRWGLEVAVFPAPTFVEPEHPDWTLLYKAGSQEVYQHRLGPHAAANRDKTVAWLRRQGRVISDPGDASLVASEARSLGGQKWLASPRQARYRAAALEAMQAGEPQLKAQAHVRLGILMYRADQPLQAREHLAKAASLDGRNPKPLLYLALVAYEGGHEAQAREHLRRMSAAQVSRLSYRQQQRAQDLIRRIGL